jgi:hypothetical protein
MKIIIEKSTNIIKWGFQDSQNVEILSDRIVVGQLQILDMNLQNSEILESISEPPTNLFQNLYEWKNSDWKLLWSVQKKIAEVSKKCSELLLEDPTGTEDEWNLYIQKLEFIQDNLLNSVNPLYVEWPKKP